MNESVEIHLKQPTVKTLSRKLATAVCFHMSTVYPVQSRLLSCQTIHSETVKFLLIQHDRSMISIDERPLSFQMYEKPYFMDSQILLDNHYSLGSTPQLVTEAAKGLAWDSLN